MDAVIEIDGKKVAFRATANTPRLYRMKLRRDLLRDMSALSKKQRSKSLEIPDLELFENIAYIMAYQADSSIGDIDSFFDSFRMFDIYEVLPKLLELWGANMETAQDTKKKKMRAAAK